MLLEKWHKGILILVCLICPWIGYYSFPLLILILIGLMSFCIVLFSLERYLFLLFVVSIPFSFDLPISANSSLTFPSEILALLLAFTTIFLAFNIKIIHYLVKHFIFHGMFFFCLVLLFSFLSTSMSEVTLKFIFINTLYIFLGGITVFTFLYKKRVTIHEFLFAILLGVFLICVYSSINLMMLGFSPETSPAMAKPFFKDHTILSALLAFITPISIYLYKVAESRGMRFFLGLCIVLILFTLFNAHSRAAWLSVFGASILYMILKLKIKKWHVFSFILIIVGMVILNKSWIEEAIRTNRNDSDRKEVALTEEVMSVSNVSTNVSNLERINRWKCAIKMGVEKPFFGYGAGTYQYEYFPFQEKADLTYISVHSPFDIKEGRGGTAHSEYLLSFAEEGVLGLLSWIILGILVFYYGFKYLRDFKNSEDQWFVMSILLGFSTYFIHAFFNNFLNSIQIGFYFWSFFGLLLYFQYTQTHR